MVHGVVLYENNQRRGGVIKPKVHFFFQITVPIFDLPIRTAVIDD